MYAMPHLIETDSRAGALVAAVNHVLLTHGPTGLTMRRIAQVSGVSTSSILHHLGSREHLLRVAAGQTAAARIRDIEYRSLHEGALSFIPTTGEHVLEARSWLAWQEMWRSEEFLVKWIGRGRAEERALLARVLDFQLSTDALDASVAMVDGLTVAVCAPQQPMRLERARALWIAHLKRYGADLRPMPSDDEDFYGHVTPLHR